MTPPKSTMNAQKVLDAYFLDNRARLLDVAAFLDRLDRTQDREAGKTDFRYRALQEGLRILTDGREARAQRLQMIFSDLSPDPLESAAGMKGASGAWKGAFK
jgi:hypothetical protein